jgi:hypothetical protein
VSRELANALMVVNRYKERVSSADRALRKYAADNTLPGERYAAVLPGGASSGHMLRKKDTKEPYVGDEAVLFAHVQDKDPYALKDVDELNPEFYEEAMAVLKHHAPHTVVSRVEIDPKVLAGYLRAAKDNPDNAVPGIEFKTVQGVVALYPDKDMVADLDEAIRTGQLSLDKALLQIEGDTDGIR